VAEAMTADDEPFVHPALFYGDEPSYLAGTTSFITEGLAAGEPVAVAVPGPNLRLLRAALGSDADRVRLLDMTVVGRNPGRIIPSVLHAFADTHPDRHVRIIGEPIWADRSDTEYPACAQHEALINLAFTGRAVTILCPYDTTALSEQVLADALRTHPVIVEGGGWRTSDAYDPTEIITAYNQPLRPPPDAATRTVDVPTLTALRQFVEVEARRVGLSEDRARDVVLVATELATNSIEHAHSLAEVVLGVDGGDLVCQVGDKGQLADPLAGRHPAGPGQARGRGLLLVHQLADLVRVHTSTAGTQVEARFTLP
jgi:anti-sigma regulatory factor (Ser/Thr protein kinase)